MTENTSTEQATIKPPFGYRELHALNRHDFVRMHTLGEVPAYVRRYPFCMSTVNGQAGADNELLVCVDKDYVGDKAASQYVQLFNDDAPTERWGVIEAFLQGYQADIGVTISFANALNDFGLFQPISASLMPAGAKEPVTVDSMFGIDEEKLNALEDGVLADLHRKGYLPRIYAHLKSLQNFQKLVRRLQEKKFSNQTKPRVFNA